MKINSIRNQHNSSRKILNLKCRKMHQSIHLFMTYLKSNRRCRNLIMKSMRRWEKKQDSLLYKAWGSSKKMRTCLSPNLSLFKAPTSITCKSTAKSKINKHKRPKILKFKDQKQLKTRVSQPKSTSNLNPRSSKESQKFHRTQSQKKSQSYQNLKSRKE